jgi:hypothetical protein
MAALFKRRQAERRELKPAEALQAALGDWRSRRSKWAMIFQGALAVRNCKRLAVAESRLAECQREITRLEGLLGQRQAGD